MGRSVCIITATTIVMVILLELDLLGQGCAASRLIQPSYCPNNYNPSVTNIGFVERRGTHFELNNKPLYFNGFNSYWLMYMASDPSTRSQVSDTLQQASKYGMNIARTWAFSDGGYRALQISPGSYNEDMFKGLDFVISEAGKHGIHLILTLVNNWEGYGGKKQYVQWGKEKGISVNNEDDFFTNSAIKQYFKNHIKAVLTRVNSITGVAYKDDPTIFSWELMNEPRCQSDLSGKSMQNWIQEMATYLKSIDANHLLDIGLEGFYGQSSPEKLEDNPGYQVGTDFIANNLVPQVDFATIHLYPEQWNPSYNDDEQEKFVQRWLEAHINDSTTVLKKPLLLTEFGKSSRTAGYNIGMRDTYLGNIYNTIDTCIRSGGACGGAVFWQLMSQGMEGWSDGYDIVLDQSPTTAGVIAQQSQRMASLDSATTAM